MSYQTQFVRMKISCRGSPITFDQVFDLLTSTTREISLLMPKPS